MCSLEVLEEWLKGTSEVPTRGGLRCRFASSIFGAHATSVSSIPMVAPAQSLTDPISLVERIGPPIPA
jgi:hypothetical protein